MTRELKKAIETIRVFDLATGINSISDAEFLDVKKAHEIILTEIVENEYKIGDTIDNSEGSGIIVDIKNGLYKVKYKDYSAWFKKDELEDLNEEDLLWK